MALGQATDPQQASQQMQQAAPQQQASWSQAAQSVQPTDTPGKGEVGADPNAPAAPGALNVSPVILTPAKRTGVAGVVDDIRDVLAGTHRPEIAHDQNGDAYVKETSLTHGQQWRKIIGNALEGAAAGLAHGRGAGHMGDAALAGVQMGEQQHKQDEQEQDRMTEQARQETLDNANRQMLRMNLAERAWKLQREPIEAAQKDVAFSQGQIDRFQKQGGQVLGTAVHPWDIGSILKVNPELAADLVKRQVVELVPAFDGEGKPAGVTVVKMPDAYRKEMAPKGTSFATWDAVNHQVVYHETADPITNGEIDDYNTKAMADMMAWHNAEAKLKQTQTAADKNTADAKQAGANAGKAVAETAKTNAETKIVPTQGALNVARTNEANAAAEKNRAEANKATAEAGGTSLADAIGTGHIAPERIGYLLARNPQLLQQVVAKYPDFDTSKAEAYPQVYKEFTSTKKNTAGFALNSGATSLRHMLELKELNTVASHIPGTAAYNAYMNKADTLSTELAAFYGDSTIPAIRHIKDTLTATLPGQREAGINTQAQSMGDKFDSYEQQWRNGAPSKAYEAPMPHIDDAAKEARAKLDPRYRQRLVTEQQGQQQPSTPQQQQHAPASGGFDFNQFPVAK